MRQGFTGEAGDVLRAFLTGLCLLRLFPVVLVNVGLTAGGVVAVATLAPASVAPLLYALVVALTVAPFVGYFALSERDQERPTVAEVGAFVGRSVPLWVVTCGPCLFLVRELDLTPNGLATFDAARWQAAASALLITGFALVMSFLGLIIATRADSLFETLAWSRWLWLLRDAQRDLGPMLAAFVGGVMLLSLTALPLLLLVGNMMARYHTWAATVCGVIGFASPLAFGAILAAKIAGAFVTFAECEARAASASQSIVLVPAAARDAPLAAPINAAAAPTSPWVVLPLAPVGKPVTTKPRQSVEAMTNDAMALVFAIRGLATTALTDLPKAITDAERLREEHPHSPGVLAELAKLYRKAARAHDATLAANRAIITAVNGGSNPVAAETYRAFIAERELLVLPSHIWLTLAKILKAGGQADDARWCEERAQSSAAS
jgi:hypothetical protein